MPRPRRRKMPAERRRRSWFDRLGPEVRIIGLVAILMGIAAAIVFWPRPKERLAEALTVVIPADRAMHLAFVEACGAFARTQKNVEVVLVEGSDDKMRAYEALWRGRPSPRPAGVPPDTRRTPRAAVGRRTGASRPAPAQPAGVDLIIGGEAYLARWARQGLLEPWDEFLQQRDATTRRSQEPADEARLAHAALEAGRCAGAQYMLPVGLELTALVVRQTDGGRQLARLSDLARLAASLGAGQRAGLGADWQGEWGPAVLLATTHAQVTPGQTARMLMGSIEGGLAFWRQGIAAGWAIGPGARTSPLGAANVPPPALEWAGHRAWFAQRDSAAVGLALPPGADKQGTICVVYGALLPQASKHKEAARRFAGEVLLSQQFQLSLARHTGLLPALVSAWQELKGKEWEALAGAAARSIPLTPELRSGDFTERFGKIATACLNGEISPQVAAERIADLAAKTQAGE